MSAVNAGRGDLKTIALLTMSLLVTALLIMILLPLLQVFYYLFTLKSKPKAVLIKFHYE